MIRFLSTFNFAGVLALAILCAVQWRTNSRLENRVRALDQLAADQQAKIAGQTQTLKEDAADLDDLHERLSLSEKQLDETLAKLRQREAEVSQLQITLKSWMEAVEARDAALKQAGQEIQQMAAQRNEAIQKYNDLAQTK
jgi:HAMP domain-containing protein